MTAYETVGGVDDNVSFDDYVAPEVVRDKNVHTLTIIQLPEARTVELTKGGEAEVVDFLLKIEDADLVNAKLVRHSLWLPKSTDTVEDKNKSLGKL